MKLITNYIYSLLKRKQIEELNILQDHFMYLTYNHSYSEKERASFYKKSIDYSNQITELNLNDSTIKLINAKKQIKN